MLIVLEEHSYATGADHVNK